MDKETYRVLASVRMERAIELVDEAKELLQNERYKSANNRAFNGCLRQFNVHYIKERVGGFEPGDYKRIANAQRIRNVSDYDDFYIADKKECQQQVEMATEFLNKARIFMEAN